jgi:hypothetical protein
MAAQDDPYIVQSETQFLDARFEIRNKQTGDRLGRARAQATHFTDACAATAPEISFSFDMYRLESIWSHHR